MNDYSAALAAIPAQVGGACTTTGTCDAGDELGILMFIRVGAGDLAETQYFSGETEEFVGSLVGSEHSADSIACWDEEITFDMCELEQEEEDQSVEADTYEAAPPSELDVCGDTEYDRARTCCNHRTGEIIGRQRCTYEIADGASPVCAPYIAYKANCKPDMVGYATMAPENPGGYGSNNFFRSGNAVVRWGCDECVELRWEDGGLCHAGDCPTGSPGGNCPDDVRCNIYEHCVPESGCEAAVAARRAGDLDAPAFQTLAGNWHDLCYQTLGKTKEECDDGGLQRFIAACNAAKIDDKSRQRCIAKAKNLRRGLFFAKAAYKQSQERAHTRNDQCCEDLFFEDAGMLDRDEERGCLKIVASDRVLEPRGSAFEALEFDDLPVAVRFEWFPSDEDPCLDDSEVINIHSIEKTGFIYPELTDADRWDQSRYYSTIRVEEVNGDIYLIARGLGGVVSHRLDTSTGVWNQVAPTYPIMNTAGWDDRQYNSTIRTEVVGTDLYLLARGAHGVISHKLDTVTGEWSQVAGTYGIMNTPGWDAVQYNSTIRTEVVGTDLYLLARGAHGVISHRLDTVTGEWSQVAGTYGIMNTPGWDAVQYNSTIQTEVVGTDLYLLARGAHGVISHRLDTVTGEWSQVAGTYPELTDLDGWGDAPQYYATIRTAVVDHGVFLLARHSTGVVTYSLNSDDGEWRRVCGNCR